MPRTIRPLLDQAITLEDNIKKAENRKRKHNGSKYNSDSVPKKPHYHGNSGGHHNHKNGNGHNHNNGSNGGNGEYKNNSYNGQNHNHPAGKKDLSHIKCYKCKQMGHYSSNCPEKKTEEAAKPNPFDKGYVNHVHLEGSYNEPGMENGTFYSSIQFEV